MRYPGGHEFEYKALRPSQIKVDPLYQRKLNNNRVNEIVKHWNGDLFNEPKVSYRDGQYWVFNGQHSTAAWRSRANGEDKPLPCKVYKGMTWLDECEAFIQQNGIAKDPSQLEKLRAMNEAKYTDVEGMVNGAKLAGFDVNFGLAKNGPNTIVAIAKLYKAYMTLGASMYLEMLTTIRDAWSGDPDAVDGRIITALTLVFKTYGGHFKNNEMARSLRTIKPAEIIRNGKSNAKRNGCSREIVKAYNNKRRNRLDIDLL